MAATAIIDRPRLEIGRVIGGSFGALRRNWWRVLILALPLEFAPELATIWIKGHLPALEFGAATPLVRPAVREWVDMAVGFLPDTLMSVYFCRWAAAEMEGAPKGFSLGDPRRVAALLLAVILADVAVGLADLLLYVPGMVLGLLWIALAPVVILEGARPVQALGRSAALTKGHRGRLVLILAISFVCDMVLRIGVHTAFDVEVVALGRAHLQTLLALSAISSALMSTLWALLWDAGAPVVYFELIRLKTGVGGWDAAAVFD